MHGGLDAAVHCRMGSLSVVGRQRLMMPLRRLGIVFVAGKRQGDGFHGDRKSNVAKEEIM